MLNGFDRSTVSTIRLIALSTVFLAACGGPLEPLQSPLRVADPVEQIVAELDLFVPVALATARVPGCAIAVVRDGVVAIELAYGVASTRSRDPVTPRTVFAAASLTKVLVAYAALREVESGRLALDRPLGDFVSEPWLPDAASSDDVTLRTVLSHSAGLSNRLLGSWTDRRIRTPPGSRFAYSGNGFAYLQAVLEELHDAPLDVVLQPRLGELGMTSSGLRKAPFGDRVASPHLPLRWVAAVLGALLAIPLALAWRLARPARVAILGVLALLASAAVWNPIVPILPLRLPEPHAAASLYTTAGDYGRFLGELLVPRFARPETVAAMRTPQVRATERVSWGLGVGIQHGDETDAIWQWGFNPGDQALVVGLPATRTGVVVLTNGGPGESGLKLAREIAHRSLGGEHYSYWRDAVTPTEQTEGSPVP